MRADRGMVMFLVFGGLFACCIAVVRGVVES
jgi:hypothetical protein